MNFGLVFNVAFAVSAVAWLVLFIAPKKRAINFWLCGTVVPLLIALLYAILCALYWTTSDQSFMERFGSMDGLLTMFNVAPGLLLAGYVHYLTFDLFIAAWMARRAAVTGLPYWLLFPSMLLTLLFGPVGLLLFKLTMLARGQHQPEHEPVPPRGPLAVPPPLGNR